VGHVAVAVRPLVALVCGQDIATGLGVGATVGVDDGGIIGAKQVPDMALQLAPVAAAMPEHVCEDAHVLIGYGWL